MSCFSLPAEDVWQCLLHGKGVVAPCLTSLLLPKVFLLVRVKVSVDVNAEAEAGGHHGSALIAPGVGIAADAIDFEATEGAEMGGLEIAVIFAIEATAIADGDNLLKATLTVGFDFDAVIGDHRRTVEAGVANGGIDAPAAAVLANEMPVVVVAGMDGVSFSVGLNGAESCGGDGEPSGGFGESAQQGLGGGVHGWCGASCGVGIAPPDVHTIAVIRG